MRWWILLKQYPTLRTVLFFKHKISSSKVKNAFVLIKFYFLRAVITQSKPRIIYLTLISGCELQHVLQILLDEKILIVLNQPQVHGYSNIYFHLRMGISLWFLSEDKKYPFSSFIKIIRQKRIKRMEMGTLKKILYELLMEVHR